VNDVSVFALCIPVSLPVIHVTSDRMLEVWLCTFLFILAAGTAFDRFWCIQSGMSDKIVRAIGSRMLRVATGCNH
jgi:hypothetical protein